MRHAVRDATGRFVPANRLTRPVPTEAVMVPSVRYPFRGFAGPPDNTDRASFRRRVLRCCAEAVAVPTYLDLRRNGLPTYRLTDVGGRG